MRYGVAMIVLLNAGCDQGGPVEGRSVSALTGGPADPVAGAAEAVSVTAISYPAPEPLLLAPSVAVEPECGIPGGSHPDPLCNTDGDGDGVVVKFDCDDRDPSRSPFVADIRCNGIDENCNDQDECDRDGDGVLAAWDCDEDDRRIGLECHSPFASDTLEPAR